MERTAAYVNPGADLRLAVKLAGCANPCCSLRRGEVADAPGS